MSIISAEHLIKTYLVGGQEIRAVDDVSLAIPAGQFTALCGASGAGKSTLLYILGGLGRPNTGTVRVADQELTQLTDDQTAEFRRHAIGFVFQFFYLMPVFSVLQNVLVPLQPVPMSAREKLDRARAVIDRVGLSHRLAHLPAELSAGEQQRAGIARAIVNNPKIIIADEPTSDLDKKNVEGVLTLLEELNKSGVTIVLATHDQRVMDRVGRVIDLEDGKILRDTVKSAPA